MAGETSTFLAKGLYIGGISAFKVTPVPTYKLAEVGTDTPFDFHVYDKEKDQEEFISNKKYVFGKNQKWSNPELCTTLKETVDIELTDGFKLNSITLTCYSFIYYDGFASVLFWIDLQKYELNFKQIVELVALTRGTAERINSHLVAKVNHKKTSSNSDFDSLCSLVNSIQKNLASRLDASILTSSKDTQPYPVTYINYVNDCEDSTELLAKFSKELTGICDAWINYAEFLKTTDAQKTIATDFHPFTYGVSVFSSAGMVEAHPKNFEKVPETTGYDTQRQHYYELVFLYLIAEVSILHRFVIKWYDDQLTEIGVKSFKIRWNFVAFISQINKITSLHNTTIQTLGQFKEAHLASKSYIPSAIDNFNQKLGITKFSESIKDKLNDLKQQITIAYSMLTTIFVILLTLLGLAFSIIQILFSINEKMPAEVIIINPDTTYTTRKNLERTDTTDGKDSVSRTHQLIKKPARISQRS